MTSTFARVWISSEIFSRHYNGIQSPGEIIRLASDAKGLAECSHIIAITLGCGKGGHDEDVRGVSCNFSTVRAVC